MKSREQTLELLEFWMQRLRLGNHSPGVYAKMDSFFAAGLEALSAKSADDGWYQINLSLSADKPHWSTLMNGSLHSSLDALVQKKQISAWWFLHKSPGVRLRIKGHWDSLFDSVTEQLNNLENNGCIAEWCWGCYQPEMYLFGGSAGLELTHLAFSIDSKATVAFHQAKLNGETALGAEIWSMLLTGWTWWCVVDDRLEFWDLCCRLTATGRLNLVGHQLGCEGGETGFTEEALHALKEPGSFPLEGRPEEIFVEYQESMVPVLDRLNYLNDRGELLWGARSLLPFWLIYHWNRMTFNDQRQRRLATSMARSFYPHG